MKNVVIVLFDDVEVLDFCGPFEVFSVAKSEDGSKPFNVVTVAQDRPVTARNGLSVNPTYLLDDAPPFSILIVPGGQGTRREMHNASLIAWIKERSQAVEMIVSVCTGALLLGKAGFLDGLDVTTHHDALDLLRESAPNANVHANKRFIDTGRIATSAGISAGIDLSLHLVARFAGTEAARRTAEHMEYDWQNKSAGCF